MLASLDPQASLYPRPRPAHYGPRLDSRHAHQHPRPNLERWGRSSSVPERWPSEPEPDWAELTAGSGLLGASLGRSASSHHGGSYLLRQRSNPLGGRLGRQYSISSDYVADASLYDPSYSYPSFHGISDSLRATIGDPPVVGVSLGPGAERDYADSDYLLHPPGPGPGYYGPERRKKTVRFDSGWGGPGDSGTESCGAEGPGAGYGWMTIQDLRTGPPGQSRWSGPGGLMMHPGLAHRAPHLWDRQESLDSQAR